MAVLRPLGPRPWPSPTPSIPSTPVTLMMRHWPPMMPRWDTKKAMKLQEVDVVFVTLEKKIGVKHLGYLPKPTQVA